MSLIVRCLISDILPSLQNDEDDLHKTGVRFLEGSRPAHQGSKAEPGTVAGNFCQDLQAGQNLHQRCRKGRT